MSKVFHFTRVCIVYLLAGLLNISDLREKWSAYDVRQRLQTEATQEYVNGDVFLLRTYPLLSPLKKMSFKNDLLFVSMRKQ